jgi:hypothetical protein
MHLWILATVLAKHCRKRRQHAGADEADAEEADLATTNAAGFVEVFLNVSQGTAGAIEKNLSGAGEANGARRAGEKSVAEDFFELADLLRERWLGEVQAECGAAKV